MLFQNSFDDVARMRIACHMLQILSSVYPRMCQCAQGCLRFHSDWLFACSKALPACRGCIVCASLCPAVSSYQEGPNSLTPKVHTIQWEHNTQFTVCHVSFAVVSQYTQSVVLDEFVTLSPADRCSDPAWSFMLFAMGGVAQKVDCFWFEESVSKTLKP